MNTRLIGGLLGAGITAFALPAEAESCWDYFNRNNLRHEEISRMTNIYLSWNGGELVDCNNNGNSSFVCGGKSYSGYANSVNDNSGTSWGINWDRTKEVFNCNQASDGTFITIRDLIYKGVVNNANIPAGKVYREIIRYRVIRPNF